MTERATAETRRPRTAPGCAAAVQAAFATMGVADTLKEVVAAHGGSVDGDDVDETIVEYIVSSSNVDYRWSFLPGSLHSFPSSSGSVLDLHPGHRSCM